MKMLRAATIWAWWCVMMYIVVMTSSVAIEIEQEKQVKQPTRYSTVTFQLSTGINGYDQFLNTLRNAVGDTRSCQVLSTRSNPPASAAYILVKLQVSSTQWVTLGIDAKNLYVWAYQNSVQQSGRYRARFLDDAPQAARDSLFTDSTQTKTGFEGNYNDLERAAGTSRRTIALTFESLDNDVRAVSGSSVPSRQVEATFFLRAIQMVAEGARFRLIQRAIHSGGAADPSFRAKLINYENNWDIISQRIHQASPQCRTPLDVGSGIIFENATQITKDMGLLKYRNVRYLSQINTNTIATYPSCGS